jgi:hypothetical protein
MPVKSGHTVRKMYGNRRNEPASILNISTAFCKKKAASKTLLVMASASHGTGNS